MADKAIKAKTRKVPSSSGITAEMLKISRKVRYRLVTHIVNQIIQEGKYSVAGIAV